MDIGADAILTVSQAGITAQMVSRFRPDTLIVALLLDEQVQRQMALYWGVEPITMPRASSSDELVDLAVRSAEQAGLVRRGDLVVVTAGVPVGISGTTNMIRVQQVGGSLVNAVGIGHAADLRPAVRVPARRTRCRRSSAAATCSSCRTRRTTCCRICSEAAAIISEEASPVATRRRWASARKARPARRDGCNAAAQGRGDGLSRLRPRRCADAAAVILGRNRKARAVKSVDIGKQVETQ